MTSNTSAELYMYTGEEDPAPKDVVSVRFHLSVIEVRDEVFRDCNMLQEVMLNDGLKIIGKRAFRSCNSLRSINTPSSVTKIGSETFLGCTQLREVVLNEGLREIGSKAFSTCISMERITTPSTVVEIREFAFLYCRRLREVVLNDGLKKIGRGVFNECSSLENISMPSTVVEIGYGAFSGCSNLRELVIHNEGVQFSNSFLRCTSLERFNFPGLSTRLDNMIQAGQRGIEAKIDDISEVEWRGGELVIPTVRREIEENIGSGMVEPATVVEVDKEKLDKVKGLIAYYEKKEATTLFELALWKFGIDQADISNSTNREAYRVEVPGPVKDTILQYLS